MICKQLPCTPENTDGTMKLTQHLRVAYGLPKASLDCSGTAGIFRPMGYVYAPAAGFAPSFPYPSPVR